MCRTTAIHFSVAPSMPHNSANAGAEALNAALLLLYSVTTGAGAVSHSMLAGTSVLA